MYGHNGKEKYKHYLITGWFANLDNNIFGSILQSHAHTSHTWEKTFRSDKYMAYSLNYPTPLFLQLLTKYLERIVISWFRTWSSLDHLVKSKNNLVCIDCNTCQIYDFFVICQAENTTFWNCEKIPKYGHCISYSVVREHVFHSFSWHQDHHFHCHVTTNTTKYKILHH